MIVKAKKGQGHNIATAINIDNIFGLRIIEDSDEIETYWVLQAVNTTIDCGADLGVYDSEDTAETVLDLILTAYSKGQAVFTMPE